MGIVEGMRLLGWLLIERARARHDVGRCMIVGMV